MPFSIWLSYPGEGPRLSLGCRRSPALHTPGTVRPPGVIRTGVGLWQRHCLCLTGPPRQAEQLFGAREPWQLWTVTHKYIY